MMVNTLFAKKGKYWQLINKKGEKQDRSEYSSVSADAYFANQVFLSDWIDTQTFIENLFQKLTPEGFGTLKLGAPLAKVATQLGLKAEDCRQYKDAIELSDKIEDTYSEITVLLSSKTTPVVQPVTEQVYRGWWEGWQTKTTGYKFNPRASADYILLKINARWPFSKHNGTERLHRAIAEYLDTHKFEQRDWNEAVNAYSFPAPNENRVLLLPKKEQLEELGLQLWLMLDLRKEQNTSK